MDASSTSPSSGSEVLSSEAADCGEMGRASHASVVSALSPPSCPRGTCGHLPENLVPGKGGGSVRTLKAVGNVDRADMDTSEAKTPSQAPSQRYMTP